MAEDDSDVNVRKAIESCCNAQAMIDINAVHLDGLRTLCPPNAELTQHEIKALESKLLKLFSKQLVAKRKCVDVGTIQQLTQYPRLRQWLCVVGICKSALEGVCGEIETFEDLLEMTEHDLKDILHKYHGRDEDIRRLLIAIRNLKKFTEKQIRGEPSNACDLDLHWESWDRTDRATRSSVPSEELLKCTPVKPQSPPAVGVKHANQASTPSLFHNYSSSALLQTPPSSNNLQSLTAPVIKERRYTPPPTPPILGKKGDKKFPTTPPPTKKHQTNLLPEAFPLTKSKSHEEHLANRIEPLDSAVLSRLLAEKRPNNHLWIGRSCENLSRRRLLTEPGLESSSLFGHGSPLLSSPSRSPPFVSPDQQGGDSCFVDEAPLQTPVPTPRSPLKQGMIHQIHHRFIQGIKFTTCDFCEKPMMWGYKCSDCKYYCHKDCKEKVPPSCGLPNEYVRYFAETFKNEGNYSPILNQANFPGAPNFTKSDSGRKKKRSRLHPSINIPAFSGPDSSSNTSSCNSSTPSSPALIITSAQQTPPSASRLEQFQFPDLNNVPQSEKDVTIEPKPIVEVVETQKSNDSDKTVSGTSGSGSTDSEKTLADRVDSQDSQVSDMDPSERSWPRQNSLSLREWDIPFDELQIEETIGVGRFGVVYKGNWHGSVAIKMLNMDDTDDKKTLETFKQEVANFRKTRHENLVLFMGACMKPPRLAIVTSLCKGMTLYKHIHVRKEKFNLSRTIRIAQQVCQGMGYLHAREILHKDLKTKNIFYENGKVVITDFGLFSVTKLCQGNRKGDWLTIPKGWLCYLAPEVIRSLKAGNQPDDTDLPFSTASDVYAFGTVWYELLYGEWPFHGQPPEGIIWQVGKGMKQPLTNIQASQDVKDILMACWAYKPVERPHFGNIQSTLLKLPKKRLARSPSHPIHLSRSAESVL